MADSDPAQSDLEPTSAQGAIRQNVLTGRSWVDYTWLLGAAVLAGLVAWTFRWLDLTGLTFFQWMQGKGVLFGVQLDATTGTILAMATVAVALPLIMWTRDRWFPGTQGTGIPQAIAALHVAVSRSHGRGSWPLTLVRKDSTAVTTLSFPFLVGVFLTI